MSVASHLAIGVLSGVFLVAACGDTAELMATGNATRAALTADNEQVFEGTLDGTTFAPRAAIWGVETRTVRGHTSTRDLVVFMSTAEDPCADWPRTPASPGHRGLIVRLSKLERSSGSATFVEPDVGTYSVSQPRNPGLPVTRGSEVVFRATPPPPMQVDAWLAHAGSVQLTEHTSSTPLVRGTFALDMVPFALDEDPQGPTASVTGQFTALRCPAMDDAR